MSPPGNAFVERLLPALVVCAPTRAETNVSFVESKFRSAWNPVGPDAPVVASCIAISTLWPARPVPSARESATVVVVTVKFCVTLTAAL